MTDQATRVVSAGWYQDPASSVQVRWWNGLAWTEHVREKPTTPPMGSNQAAAQTAAQTMAHTTAQGAIGQGVATGSHDISATETSAERIAAVRELEHQFGIGSVEHPVASVRSSSPASAASSMAAANLNSASHASTASAWMIALSPLLALVVGIAAAYVYLYLFSNVIVFVVAVAIPYLLCLLWAFTDGRTLRRRGYNPPSPLFALLTGLGYLIVRRTPVRRRAADRRGG